MDLVDLLHPGMKKNPDFERFSTFGAIELYNVLWRLSSYFEQWTPDAMAYRQGSESLHGLGFESYVKSIMPELFGRALIILRDLGFRPAMGGFIFERTGTSCLGHESDPKIVRKTVHTEGEQ